MTLHSLWQLTKRCQLNIIDLLHWWQVALSLKAMHRVCAFMEITLCVHTCLSCCCIGCAPLTDKHFTGHTGETVHSYCVGGVWWESSGFIWAACCINCCTGDLRKASSGVLWTNLNVVAQPRCWHCPAENDRGFSSVLNLYFTNAWSTFKGKA